MSKQHGHKKKVVVRRPNAIVLKICGVFSSHQFELKTLPDFTRANVLGWLRKAWQEKHMTHLISRLRKDAKLDLDSGEGDAPQIDSALELNSLQEQMNKYILWKFDKGALHINSPIRFVQAQLITAGYVNGTLKTHVFDDAARAVKEWRYGKHYLKNYTMDEGSKEGQKHYVQSTTHGDLSKCFNNYVAVTDPHLKVSPNTYKIVVSMIRDTPDNIMFVTDDPNEARAAQSVGLITVVIQRPGEQVFPPEELTGLTVVTNLDELEFDDDPSRPPPCC